MGVTTWVARGSAKGREYSMRGLGKFLFGGLLGAIFGFLVSPKRAQHVRDALFGEHHAADDGSRRITAAPYETTMVEHPPVTTPPPADREAFDLSPTVVTCLLYTSDAADDLTRV